MSSNTDCVPRDSPSLLYSVGSMSPKGIAMRTAGWHRPGQDGALTATRRQCACPLHTLKPGHHAWEMELTTLLADRGESTMQLHSASRLWGRSLCQRCQTSSVAPSACSGAYVSTLQSNPASSTLWPRECPACVLPSSLYKEQTSSVSGALQLPGFCFQPFLGSPGSPSRTRGALADRKADVN